MNSSNQWVLKKYEQDEEMMVLLFAQWCENHQLDAWQLYEKAYPGQPKNKLLENAMEQTVDKMDAEVIPNDLLLQTLQAFGNDDLAFVVQENIDTNKKSD